jgi:hypothetical protein
LQKNLFPQTLNPSVYIPTGQAARYLQYHYIASNPNPVGQKDNSSMLVMAAITPKLMPNIKNSLQELSKNSVITIYF